jgi:hypothetical protein
LGQERRRDERIETNVHLTCRVPALPCRSIMHDLSHVGCRLEFRDADIELGGTVLLDVPGASRVSGRVMWRKGRRAGIEFDRWLGASASVALGLEEPEPVKVEELPAEPQNGSLPRLLRHWMRRLTSRFA